MGQDREYRGDQDWFERARFIDEVSQTKIGTRLEIMTKDGKRFHAFEEDKSSLPYSFIKHKFSVFASIMLTDENVKKIVELVDCV